VSDKARIIGTAGGALGLGAVAAAVSACCWLPWAAFGRLLSKGVGLKNGDRQVYARDVWLPYDLPYDPQTQWSGAEPPRPRLLMQELRSSHRNVISRVAGYTVDYARGPFSATLRYCAAAKRGVYAHSGLGLQPAADTRRP
jgi:hypothetical protein